MNKQPTDTMIINKIVTGIIIGAFGWICTNTLTTVHRTDKDIVELKVEIAGYGKRIDKIETYEDTIRGTYVTRLEVQDSISRMAELLVLTNNTYKSYGK